MRAIFDVFLSRNVPGEREAFYTYAEGDLYDTRFAPGLRELRIGEIDALALSSGVQRGEAELDDGERIRYLVAPVETGGRAGGVFAVAIDLSGELGEVNDALRIAAGVSIGVLILASLLAWAVAGRVLAPLRLLRDTARSIGESDLTGRIPVEGGDELADIARTFNEMLDRLEEAFASQKAFISDAGHELRTPITIIRGHLDVMGDDPDERRETLELVADELDRMARLVNDLLLLAKASRPDFLEPQTIDLDDLTRELFAKASALAERDWRLASVGSGRIVADRQRLTQALMNLSQNAVAHTARRGRRSSSGRELAGQGVRLWVRDTGPGVPEHEQARIFERFVARSTAAATPTAPGSGSPSPAPSPRPTAAASSSTAAPAPAPRFTVVIPTEPPQEVRPA